MARRKEGVRVLGPYTERGGTSYRLILVDERGKKTPRLYATYEGALAVRRDILKELGGPTERTVEAALETYKDYLGEPQPSGAGNQENSVKVSMWRLRAFLKKYLEWTLRQIDPVRAEAIYREYCKTETRHKKPPSGDTQLNALAECKTFFDWCAYDQRWITVNPFAAIEGSGKRNHGKPQLRIDEARKWTREALRMCDENETEMERAVAATMTLALNLREGEILALTVRDLDDDSRIVCVEDTKTRAGERRLQVPDFIRPYVLRLIKGKPPSARVFPHALGWVTDQVKRICKRAKLSRVVTSHSMRGLHSTLSIEAGATPHQVAEALGHTSYDRVTKRSYVAPGTDAKMQAARALRVLQGGVA